VRWLQNEEIAARVEADTRAWLADIDAEGALVEAWRAHDEADRSFASFTRFSIGALAARFGKDPSELLRKPRRRRFSDPV